MKMRLVFILRQYFIYPLRIFILKYFKHKNDNNDNNDIYVFHHIPKTAGTTFNAFLSNNFMVFKDYRLGWSNNIPKPFNIKHFDNNVCISGHFNFSENYTVQKRYNDQLIKYNKTFKIITFLREPLELRISLYKYLKKNNQIDDKIEINDFILIEKNFLANALNCDYSNYKEIICSYFFIGFVDDFEYSLNKLSKLLGVKHNKVSRKNVSKTKLKISNQIKESFYKSNKLDYELYNFAKKRFITND